MIWIFTEGEGDGWWDQIQAIFLNLFYFNFLIILDRYNEVLIFFQCTTTTASESHSKNGAHCNCCYCEVFGPGGQSVAPVSRNYPEMRERLRLLLSKKKRKNQQKPPPPPPKKHAEQQQQQQQQHHQHQVWYVIDYWQLKQIYKLYIYFVVF